MNNCISINKYQIQPIQNSEDVENQFWTNKNTCHKFFYQTYFPWYNYIPIGPLLDNGRKYTVTIIDTMIKGINLRYLFK